MKIIEERQIEKRIWCDPNGLYHIQLRYIPVYPWEGDGWKTIYASTSKKDVLAKYYGKEF